MPSSVSRKGASVVELIPRNGVHAVGLQRPRSTAINSGFASLYSEWGRIVIARALIAQSAINHNEIWKPGGWGILTGRGNANQKVDNRSRKALPL